MKHEPKIRQIFLEALEKPTPHERHVYLERACGGDSALRYTIEVLLKSHREDGFLEKPAVEVEKAVTAPDGIPSESRGDVTTAPIFRSPTDLGVGRKQPRSNS